MFNTIRPSSPAAKALIPCVLLALAAAPIPAAHGQNRLWITQFGTSGDDLAMGLASDGMGG